MTVTLEEPPLPSDREELLAMLQTGAPEPLAPWPNRIEAADVAPFVESGLKHSDLRLIARMARIARRGGEPTLMRCLGIAARTPAEIGDELERFANEEPPDEFVVDSLEAAQLVHLSNLERRFAPSAQARRDLLANYPRYADLLDSNRRNPADRTVQYYAIGRIAGMVASASEAPPVQ